MYLNSNPGLGHDLNGFVTGKLFRDGVPGPRPRFPEAWRIERWIRLLLPDGERGVPAFDDRNRVYAKEEDKSEGLGLWSTLLRHLSHSFQA